MDWSALTSQWGLPSSFSLDQFSVAPNHPNYSAVQDLPNQAAAQFYTGPGQGSSNNNSNFAFLYDNPLGDNATSPIAPSGVEVKSADKTGSIFDLIPGQDGQLTPKFSHDQYWDTNPGSIFSNYILPAAAAFGGPFALSQLGTGGLASLLSGGASAADSAGALSPFLETAPGEAAGAFSGSAIPAAGSAGASSPFLETAPGEASGAFAGSAVPSSNLPFEAGFVPSAASPAGSAGNLASLAGGAGTVANLAKGAGGAASLLTSLFGGGGSSQGGLGPLIASLFGAQQNNSNASNLNNYIDRATNRMLPLYNQLADSFTNPNSYLQSPEAKALSSIDENNLLRTDSARGGLSNDTARSQLLQKYAYQHLNDYRGSLQNAYETSQRQVTSLSDMAQLAIMLKNGQYNPILNAIGQGGSGVGGDIQSVINALFGGGGGGGTTSDNLFPGFDSSGNFTDTDNFFDPVSGP